MHKINELLKCCLFTAVCLIAVQTLYSQNNGDSFHNLNVGESLPGGFEVKTFNYNSGKVDKIKLSSLRGKFLILDLWSHNCLSCIEKMPHMEEIQKKYRDNVNVLMVNDIDNLDEIKSLLNLRKKSSGLGLSLNTVFDDTIIARKLFLHKSIPHIVWVDTSGKVLSITSSEYVKDKYIKIMMAGGRLTMPLKQDKDRITVDWEKPLFIKGNGGNGEALQWTSQLSGFIEGLPHGTTVFTSNDKKQNYSVISANSSIATLYSYAYADSDPLKNYLGTTYLNRPIPNSRFKVRVKDSTTIVPYIDGEYHPENLYNYQFLSPKPYSIKELQLAMQTDLNKYFGYKVTKERRRMPCYVLSCEDTSLLTKTQGDVKSYVGLYKYVQNNRGIDDLYYFLQNVKEYGYGNYDLPIINDVKFYGKTGVIELNCFIGDPVKLNLALEKYKMHFKIEEREVDVYILSDKL